MKGQAMLARFTLSILALTAICVAPLSAADKEEGFKVIFDGKSMDGWKVSEHKDSFKLIDGALVAHGERAHCFYVGDEKPFKDLELRVDVKTEPGSNGGIYFHTKWQETGWPKYGFEAQVNNTHTDWRKTGSLYQVQDVKEQVAQDGKWWTETIIVKGNRVIIKIDDKTVVDYTEPADTKPGTDFTRKLDSGTFALQGHDPKSTVSYKNIRVKRLD
jgi:hypothetical protein